MAFDENIADRVRRLLLDMGFSDLTEKRMFGGLSFLYKGKMTVGVVKEELAVRVLPDEMDHWLEEPFVRPMDFTKKPMKEFIFVEREGFKTDAQLRQFIEMGVAHARSKLGVS